MARSGSEGVDEAVEGQQLHFLARLVAEDMDGEAPVVGQVPVLQAKPDDAGLDDLVPPVVYHGAPLATGHLAGGGLHLFQCAGYGAAVDGLRHLLVTGLDNHFGKPVPKLCHGPADGFPAVVTSRLCRSFFFWGP